jgi:hypothetical protein
MPIRLNLLAEAQAAEDARRRDPVKRAIWVACLLVVLILVWSSSLQLKAILIHSEVNRLEAQINSHTNDYHAIVEEQTKTTEIKHRLDALHRLSENRLLNATLLDALQRTTVNDVQLLRLRIDQIYSCVEGTKAKTNDDGAIIPAKPAKDTEKIMLTLEGSDSSPNPGDQVSRYKNALATNAYFAEMLTKTNGVSLKNLAPPQISQVSGKLSVNFALECRYPEVTR